MPNEKILIVEDDRLVAEGTKRILIKLGFDVSGIIAYGEKAFEKAKECLPDLILMDIMLKGSMNGTEATNQSDCRQVPQCVESLSTGRS